MSQADEIEELYRSVIERFDELDAWVFRQDLADYPAFAAARSAMARHVLDEASRVLALVTRFSGDGRPSPAKLYARKIAVAIATEKRLAEALDTPLPARHLDGLDAELMAGTHLYAGHRVYRYLVWQRRSLATTATPEIDGISAVLRVKNESRHLRVMLPVLLTYFDEIVVVDHASTDDTYAYVASLDHPKIKLYRYLTATAPDGEFYARERRRGRGSLAEYYNFAFSKASMGYVCKWDGDMYPLPSLRELLASVHAARWDVVSINGVDCYGYASCNHEPRIYRRSLELRYVDLEYYEGLDIVGGDRLRGGRFEAPVYLHMKHVKLLDPPRTDAGGAPGQ